MTRKEEITKNMRLLGISRKEAEQLYLDDHQEKPIAEVAEMEKKVKSLGRRYETSVRERKPSSRTKQDTEKQNFLSLMFDFLLQHNFKNVCLVNPQQEITFYIGTNFYSLKLTKHKANYLK
jgi:hypothetical protein